MRDLLASMVETTPRTGTSNLAQALFSRPLAVWIPAAGGAEEAETMVMPRSSS